MNILVIGTENFITELCKNSKLVDNVYTETSEDISELLEIAKKYSIDIAISNNPKLAKNGIVEIFRKNKINIVSVNQKWLNLETSKQAAKQLMEHYSINCPKTIKAPTTFPIIIKTDSEKTLVANSMNELIEYRKNLPTKNVFLEEYLEGEIYELISLWDEKNILFFDMNTPLTEVQEERLELYKTKLIFMLSDENADFIGFICSRLIWAKNDWYVLDYKMRIDEKSDLSGLKSDFVYILNSAIYQKLNEI